MIRSGDGKSNFISQSWQYPQRTRDCGDAQIELHNQAQEERRAHPLFQRPHRLANCRRRDAEVGRGAAEIAMPGHTEKGFHPVKRALPDCEVLLHG